jgi:hypothetical protein
MNSQMVLRPLTVSSVFANIESLIVKAGIGNALPLLGARWDFGLPNDSMRSTLCEYSFPHGRAPYLATVEKRTGFVMTHHAASESADIYMYLTRAPAAIVAVDSFYLPYRPAYKRVHSHRTIIVESGDDSDEVVVEDTWMPTYKGPLRVADLELARHSQVALEPDREPIYAGVPVQGEWISIDSSPSDMNNGLQNPISLLALLLQDWSATSHDAAGVYGRGAICQFRSDLGESLCKTGPIRLKAIREASLIIRSELSPRVYLCRLLCRIARLPFVELGGSLQGYYHGLHSLAMARDVLAKSLRDSRKEFDTFVLASVDAWIAAEYRLAESIGLCANCEVL